MTSRPRGQFLFTAIVAAAVMAVIAMHGVVAAVHHCDDEPLARTVHSVADVAPGLGVALHLTHVGSDHAANGDDGAEGHDHGGSSTLGCIAMACAAAVLAGLLSVAVGRPRARSIRIRYLDRLVAVLVGPEPPVPKLLLNV